MHFYVDSALQKRRPVNSHIHIGVHRARKRSNALQCTLGNLRSKADCTAEICNTFTRHLTHLNRKPVQRAFDCLGCRADSAHLIGVNEDAAVCILTVERPPADSHWPVSLIIPIFPRPSHPAFATCQRRRKGFRLWHPRVLHLQPLTCRKVTGAIAAKNKENADCESL